MVFRAGGKGTESGIPAGERASESEAGMETSYCLRRNGVSARPAQRHQHGSTTEPLFLWAAHQGINHKEKLPCAEVNRQLFGIREAAENFFPFLRLFSGCTENKRGSCRPENCGILYPK